MSRAPDTLPPADDWRSRAACLTAKDPEIFFPVGEGPQAQQQTKDAKRICHTCPAMTDCLNWALETHQDSGIWGGLDERERRRIHRRKARGGIPPQPVRTLAGVLAERSTAGTNGHTNWNGTSPVTINGTCYTAAQLAWHVAYGKAPNGSITVECGHPGCITVGHLMDAAGRKQRHGTPAAWQAHKRRGEDPCEECAEANRVAKREWYESSPRHKGQPAVPECGTRAGYDAHLSRGDSACDACCASRWGQETAVPECGTRPGYQAHRKRGEEACRPCKDANADADRRLRNTGTTKQLTPERSAA